jgi:hypothetical protein
LTDLPIKLSWLTNRLLYYRDRLATEIINFQGYAVLDDRLTYDLSTTSGHAICVLDRAIIEMRKIKVNHRSLPGLRIPLSLGISTRCATM